MEECLAFRAQKKLWFIQHDHTVRAASCTKLRKVAKAIVKQSYLKYKLVALLSVGIFFQITHGLFHSKKEMDIVSKWTTSSLQEEVQQGWSIIVQLRCNWVISSYLEQLVQRPVEIVPLSFDLQFYCRVFSPNFWYRNTMSCWILTSQEGITCWNSRLITRWKRNWYWNSTLGYH